jgi:hypothetical protein
MSDSKNVRHNYFFLSGCEKRYGALYAMVIFYFCAVYGG